MLSADHSHTHEDIASSKGIGGRDYERFPWTYHPNWDNPALHHVVRVEDVFDEVYDIFKCDSNRIRALDGTRCIMFPQAPMGFDLRLIADDATTSRPDTHLGRRWPDTRAKPMPCDLIVIRKLARRFFMVDDLDKVELLKDDKQWTWLWNSTEPEGINEDPRYTAAEGNWLVMFLVKSMPFWHTSFQLRTL